MYKNDLKNYFNKNNKRLIHKWRHYFDIYDHHFHQYRGKDVVVLEIGVSQGGSLQMWKEYFGPKAKIYGIDIDSRCKKLEEENIQVFIGSQSDRLFLSEIKKQIPPIDILIDDGGHMMDQQRISFEELFGYIKSDGIYLCEDLHTSYLLRFGGGHKRRGTFVEYSKNFIDYLNADHSEQRSLKSNYFTKSVNSVHYYEGMLIVKKSPKTKPASHLRFGNESFPNLNAVNKIFMYEKVFYKMLYGVNLLLRFLGLPTIKHNGSF